MSQVLCPFGWHYSDNSNQICPLYEPTFRTLREHQPRASCTPRRQRPDRREGGYFGKTWMDVSFRPNVVHKISQFSQRRCEKIHFWLGQYQLKPLWIRLRFWLRFQKYSIFPNAVPKIVQFKRWRGHREFKKFKKKYLVLDTNFIQQHIFLHPGTLRTVQTNEQHAL